MDSSNRRKHKAAQLQDKSQSRRRSRKKHGLRARRYDLNSPPQKSGPHTISHIVHIALGAVPACLAVVATGHTTALIIEET